MQLLKESGYKKTLIFDCSCGSFIENFDSPTRNAKRILAESLGVAGGNVKN